MNETITIIVDGQPLAVSAGEPLLPALLAAGFNIPALCYHTRLGAQRRCSLCIVEVFSQGRWKASHACTLPSASGLEIRTASPAIHRLRALAAQMLQARAPFREQAVAALLNDVLAAAEAAGVAVAPPRAASGVGGAQSESALPEMAKGCILCGRCVAVCRKIGRSYLTFLDKGTKLRISYAPGAASNGCGACRACARLCPTAFIRTNGQTAFAASLYPE
ncbi:2Fe-2S iron-sulfur cluster-binding protein [Anaeroselena agilis]|uniref:2Fe-2S iron-sulfur cluster-binding protein n=1 Tax=Anaeroselena agilis TaxID=3063788 RepID=A0ABU3P2L5_9FIRM|nr:2Fe-2S iron-sulfur cluster-binding protein [Selenomonadales bacterium 4137-cl]